jgi:ribonuclease HII
MAQQQCVCFDALVFVSEPHMTDKDMRRWMHAGCLEAGVDEVGRGCLAGPVVAAAVVWNPSLELDGPEARLENDIRDSKKLSARRRRELAAFIEDHAVACAVCFVDAQTIDRKNILQATFDAMHGALDALQLDVDVILVDGPVFRRRPGVRHVNVVGGDDMYVSIAAASILAKVRRDEYMVSQHQAYPEYDWDTNKGYGTARHLDALRTHGVTPFHRMTFRPIACEEAQFPNVPESPNAPQCPT